MDKVHVIRSSTLKKEKGAGLDKNGDIKLWDNLWSKDSDYFRHDSVLLTINKLSGIKKILEIGAGSGEDLTMLYKLGHVVTYSDLSEVAVRNFAKKNPLIYCVQVDARNLSIKEGNYDLVFCLGLLEHFDFIDRKKIINEMFRVSRKYVLIDVPQTYSISTLIKKLMSIMHKWPYGREIDFNYWSLVSEIKKSRNNFKIVGNYGRELFPLPRSFKNRFYNHFPQGIKLIYIKLLNTFFWGVAGSFGIVFKKEIPKR